MTRKIDLGTADGEPFLLDLDDYRRTGFRCGIFGASGTGKGWTLAKIIEGFIEHGVPVLMVDPEQELWTFKEIGALVVGGKHADAPFVENVEAIDAVIRFCLSTATPVVFDIGQVAEAVEEEASRLADLIAQRVWAIEDDLRIEMLFATTEASITAPQTVARGGVQRSTLRQMFQRGRKRGVMVAIETQRLADIQKACISQANVRLFGAINTADDWAAVGRNLPGRTFQQQQAQPPGVFYLVPGGIEIAVGPRRVTHGGGGPEAGDIQIRETKRANLGDVLAMLNEAAEHRAPAGQTAEVVARAKASTAQHRERVRGTGHEYVVGMAEHDAVKAERDGAVAANRRLERRAQAAEEQAAATQTALDDVTASAAALRERLAAYESLAAGLRAVVGNVAPVDAEAVRTFVREEMARQGTNGAAPAVLSHTGVLQQRYMERAAERLVERMGQLSADEREVLLFLMAHPEEAFSISDIARGVAHTDGGSTRQKYTTVANSLVSIGLVRTYGARHDRRMQKVDEWVRTSLAPHNPSDDDVALVTARAMEVILTDA